MIKELGYCSGIENYSRYFDGRKPGGRPFCLIDYFPKNFITVIDESHVTIPQIGGMIGGDRSRKENLVNYGFRLPAAIDNRPLTLPEFESMVDQVIYVSATPADYELNKREGIIVEQIIRPTGLLDPIIEVEIAKLDRKNDSLVVVMNYLNGEVIVTHAHCKGQNITFKSFKRNALKVAVDGNVDVLCEVNVKASGTMYDENTLILNLTYDGEAAVGLLKYILHGDDIHMVATRN